MTDESFTHGMLYVALYRIGSLDCMPLLVREDCQTRNVVYSEVFVQVQLFNLFAVSAVAVGIVDQLMWKWLQNTAPMNYKLMFLV